MPHIRRFLRTIALLFVATTPSFVVHAQQTAASAPVTASAPQPTALDQAIRDEKLKRMGILPGTSKYEIIKRWGDMAAADPDIQRAIANPANGFSDPAMMQMTAGPAVTMGLLRVSAEDRYAFFSLTASMIDRALPPDCGGISDPRLAMQKYMSFAYFSDTELETYFRVLFNALKALGANAPLAGVTMEKRAAAMAAVDQELNRQLERDPAAMQRFATITANFADAQPADRCWYGKMFGTAMLKLAPPIRDDAIVAVLWASLAPMVQKGQLGASAVAPAPEPQQQPANGATPAESSDKARGHAWLVKGDNDRAIAAYNEAIRLNPQDDTAYFSRGFAQFVAGRFDAAASDFSESCRIHPQYAYAHIWRNLSRSRSGNTAVATSELLAGSATLDKEKWPGPVIELLLGRRDPAAVLEAADHQNADTRREQVCEAHYYLGEYHLLNNRPNEARAMLRSAEQDCPKAFLEFLGAVAELKRLQH